MLDPCIVRMSKVEIESFTYADMYNVTAQEFGHCLGLRHVGSQGGIEPTSEQKHPEHDVMNGFYTHWIGAAGTHLHCISNLDVLALETSFGMANPGPGTAMDGTLLMPVDAYGDTCSAPPADWRTMLPAGQPGTPAEPPVSEIDNPREGDVLRAQGFTRVFGTATSDDELIEEVSVALARKRGHGCEWWDPALAELVAGTCEEPLWSPAKGAESWRWSVGSVLPKGRYRVLARATTWSQQETCCEAGSNLVEFRLR
jgi:hypothetical protein